MKILLLLLSVAILTGGCVQGAEMKTVKYTVEIPYFEEVETKEPKTTNTTIYLKKYEIAGPYFPLRKGVLKIAILPFTHSTRQNNKGIEVAEEIEFELIKRSDRYQTSSEEDIRDSVTKYLSNSYCGITDEDIARWVRENKQEKYEIVNRTLISDILQESEMQNLTLAAITKAKDILGVDALLTGHARESNNGELSFIMKAIDTKSSKVVFTERYEGGYTDTIRSAVDAFYFNIQKTENKCEKIISKTELVTVKKKITKYRTETKTKRVKQCLWAQYDSPGGKWERYRGGLYSDPYGAPIWGSCSDNGP